MLAWSHRHHQLPSLSSRRLLSRPLHRLLSRPLHRRRCPRRLTRCGWCRGQPWLQQQQQQQQHRPPHSMSLMPAAAVAAAAGLAGGVAASSAAGVTAVALADSAGTPERDPGWPATAARPTEPAGQPGRPAAGRPEPEAGPAAAGRPARWPAGRQGRTVRRSAEPLNSTSPPRKGPARCRVFFVSEEYRVHCFFERGCELVLRERLFESRPQIPRRGKRISL